MVHVVTYSTVQCQGSISTGGLGEIFPPTPRHSSLNFPQKFKFKWKVGIEAVAPGSVAKNLSVILQLLVPQNGLRMPQNRRQSLFQPYLGFVSVV